MGEAADGDVGIGEAGAAGGFEEVEDEFPLAEGVEERGEGAEVEAVGAHGDEVGGDAVEFAHDGADVLARLGISSLASFSTARAQPMLLFMPAT